MTPTPAGPEAGTTPTDAPSTADLYAEVRRRIADIPEAERFGSAVQILGEDPSSFTVHASRRINGHRKAAVWSCPLTLWDEGRLAAEAGPGEYVLQLRNARGRIVTNMELAIDPAAARFHVNTDAPSAPLDELRREMLDDMKAEMARLADELRGVRSPPQSTGSGLTLADALALMRELRPPADPVTIKDLLPLLMSDRDKTPVTDMIAGLKELRGMASEGGGGESGQDWTALIPLIAQALSAQPPQPQQPPPAGLQPAPPAPQIQPAVRSISPSPPAPADHAAPGDSPPQSAPAPTAPDPMAAIADPITASILFGQANGLTAETTAQALEELIDQWAQEHGETVPVDPSNPQALADWLIGSRGDDARAMLDPARKYVAEIAGVIIEDLTADTPPEQTEATA